MTTDESMRLSRRALGALTALLAALIIGAVVFEVVRTPKKPRVVPGIACLVAAESRVVPVPSQAQGRVLTDGDRSARGSQPSFWYVLGRGRNAEARHVVLLPSSVLQTSFPVRLPVKAPTTLDVATWGSTEPMIFALRDTGSGIVVTGSSIGYGSRVVVRGFAKIPASRHDVRDLAMARAGGTRPDLFVIDRDLQAGITRLSIYSGESRFQKAILRGQTIFMGRLDPNLWSFDVARTTTGTADVVFVRRAAGAPTGRPELHVLSGRSGFKTFSLHEILSARLLHMGWAAFGPSLTGPSLYSFEFVGRRTGRLRVTPITTPVYAEQC